MTHQRRIPASASEGRQSAGPEATSDATTRPRHRPSIHTVESDVSSPPSFAAFVENHESGIRHALMAQLGGDLGRDAAGHALLYGLENWERVGPMANPAGYLFRVGQRWGRRHRPRNPRVEVVAARDDHWFEPALVPALAGIPIKQRTAVVLRHGLDMSYDDIAALTNSSQAAARKNVERGLTALRAALGVDSE